MEYLELDESNPVLHRMNFLNGRIDATKNSSFNIEKSRIKASEHQINIISRNLDCTEVSKLFFSIDNINEAISNIRNNLEFYSQNALNASLTIFAVKTWTEKLEKIILNV